MSSKLVYAGIRRRAFAVIIDSVLLVVGALFLGVELFISPFEQPLWVVLRGSLVLSLSSLTYFILFELITGATVGKLVAGIRVVSEDGSRCSFGQIAKRNILRVIDILPAFYLVGGVLSLRSYKNQRLGDRVAGTVVARHPVPKAVPPSAPFLFH